MQNLVINYLYHENQIVKKAADRIESKLNIIIDDIFLRRPFTIIILSGNYNEK